MCLTDSVNIFFWVSFLEIEKMCLLQICVGINGILPFVKFDNIY